MKGTIDIKCTQCNRINSRRYEWIDPSKFKDSKNAFLTACFHCAFCSRGNAVRIRFLPNQQMSLEENLDFKSLIHESSVLLSAEDFGAGNSESGLPEILSESDALSLLNDADELNE